MNSVKILLVSILACHANTENNNNGVYGKDWVVFVDRRGKPHNVSLAIPKEPVIRERMNPAFGRNQPRYWLYTRKSINESEEILVPIQNKTNFNPNDTLVVLVHGWLSDRDGDSVQFIKNAILTTPKRNDNVIIMDWSSTQSLNYIASAEVTLSVAEKLKDFVQSLANIYHINGSKIHFVGHSLGAHVVGLAGGKLKQSNFTISRVTGLDPASPFFELPAMYPGITKDAAAFVDIIHTSAGSLGIRKPVGHADFYPGGGIHQPAGTPPSPIPGVCEHGSAYEYFQKSYTVKFKARKCKDYLFYILGRCNENEMQYMGEPCESTARGSYFLDIKTLNN